MELSKKQLNEIAKQLHSLETERINKNDLKIKQRRYTQFKKQMKDNDFVKDTIIEMLTEKYDEDEGLDDYNTMSMLFHLYYDTYEIIKNKTKEIEDLINEIDLKK